MTQTVKQTFRSSRMKEHVAVAVPHSSCPPRLALQSLIPGVSVVTDTSDISFTDVDKVERPTVEALLGTVSFAQRGRIGDALSCIQEALLPI